MHPPIQNSLKIGSGNLFMVDSRLHVRSVSRKTKGLEIRKMIKPVVMRIELGINLASLESPPLLSQKDSSFLSFNGILSQKPLTNHSLSVGIGTL
jgi:hypothetical protein